MVKYECNRALDLAMAYAGEDYNSNCFMLIRNFVCLIKMVQRRFTL